jgi:hypothetical protein
LSGLNCCHHNGRLLESLKHRLQVHEHIMAVGPGSR